MSNQYQPGTYVKGDQARRCETPADAVNAVFEGFKLQDAAESTDVEPGEQDATATPDPGSAQESSVDPTPDGSPSSFGAFQF